MEIEITTFNGSNGKAEEDIRSVEWLRKKGRRERSRVQSHLLTKN